MILKTITLPTGDRVDLMDGISGPVRITFLSGASNARLSTDISATEESNGAVQADNLVRIATAEPTSLDWDSSVPLYAYGNGSGNKLGYAITRISSVGLSVNCS